MKGDRLDETFKIRLWRAADDDYVVDSASFAETRNTAELYTNNPNFGGAFLWFADVLIDPSTLLDLSALSEEEAQEELKKALGKTPSLGGAITTDRLIPHVAEDLADAGIQWVRVSETYPEDTVTWIYVGGSFGDEPELKRARPR